MNIYDDTDIFKAYIRNVTEKDYFVDLIRSDDSLIAHIKNQKKLLINDIGTHEGTLFLKIMSALEKVTCDKCIEVDAVEPSKPALAEFQKKNIDKYKINFFPTTYDSFTPNKNYDLTIASHCLYWSPCLKDIIVKMLNHSKFTYIIVRGKRGTHEIFSKFRHCIGNKMAQSYNAKDIEKILEEVAGKTHSISTHNFTSELNISYCKRPKDPEGEKLISFFLQNQYAHIPEKDKKDIHLWFDKKTDIIPNDVSVFKIVNNK